MNGSTIHKNTIPKLTGSPELCCTSGGPHSIGNYTCPMEYWKENWSNGQCDSYLQTFCMSGTNLFDSKVCANWVGAFPKGNPILDSTLIDVCLKPENVNQTNCSCIIATNSLKNALGNPNNLRLECVSSECLDHPHAFRTSNQLLPCPSTIDCALDQTNAKFVANDSKDFSVNFTQSCKSTIQRDIIKGIRRSKYLQYGLVALAIFLAVLLVLGLIFAAGRNR